MAWGTDAGYAINPARDFGPRLASFFTGYGSAMRDQNGGLYFWVPIVGPLIGGPLGAVLYDALVGRYLPIDDAEQEPGRSTTDPDEDVARGARPRPRPRAHGAHAQGATATATTELRSENRG